MEKADHQEDEQLSEYYLIIKELHRTLAYTSGGFFAIRGIAVMLGHTWPVLKSVRRISQLIDTGLLLAALLLLGVLHLNPFTTPWLAVKLTLLVLYIAFGIVALHGQRRRSIRLITWALAMFCFINIIGVAISHDPLGFFRNVFQ